MNFGKCDKVQIYLKSHLCTIKSFSSLFSSLILVSLERCMKEITSELMMNFRTSTVARVFTLVDRLVNSAHRCTSRRRRVILLPRAVQIRSTWPRLRWIGFPDYGDPSGHPRINPYEKVENGGWKGESGGSRAIRIARKVKLGILRRLWSYRTDFLLREQQFTKRNRTLVFPDLVTRTRIPYICSNFLNTVALNVIHDFYPWIRRKEMCIVIHRVMRKCGHTIWQDRLGTSTWD